MPYFFSGTFAASAMECVMYGRYLWRKRQQSALSQSTSPLVRDLGWIGTWLWIVSPDIVVGLIIIELLEVGSIYDQYPVTYAVRQVWFPMTFLVLFVLGVMQSRESFKNLSKYIFTNPSLTILGYCSFPLYLFQQIVLGDYLPRLHGTDVKSFSYTELPMWERVLTMLLLIAYCWLVQRYVVDTLIVWMYQRMLTWWDSKPVLASLSSDWKGPC